MLSRSGSPLLALLALSSSASAQTLPDLYVCDTEGDKVWFCTDLDGSFDYNGANELVAFYDDTLGAHPLSNNSGLYRGPDGALYVTDSTEDIVLRLVDSNNDGDAHDAGEAEVWFDGRVGGERRRHPAHLVARHVARPRRGHVGRELERRVGRQRRDHPPGGRDRRR
jgi:hypothetical protein